MLAGAGSRLLDRARFVLVRPRGSLNIGLVARALKNMGLRRLDLGAPPAYRERIARSMCSRAEDLLDRMRVFDDLPSALAEADLVVAATSRQGARRGPFFDPVGLAQHLLSAPGDGDLVLVLGPEDPGLAAAALDHCPLRVTIPTDPAYPSLNLAQAAQVLAYELRLAALGEPRAALVGSAPATTAPAASGASPVSPAAALHRPATRGELEGFYGQLEELLDRIGFLNPQNPRHIQTSLRRLYDRAAPDLREVQILRGILSSCTRLLDRQDDDG